VCLAAALTGSAGAPVLSTLDYEIMHESMLM